MIDGDKHRDLPLTGEGCGQVGAPHRVHRVGDDGAVVVARASGRADPRGGEEIGLAHEPQHATLGRAKACHAQTGPDLPVTFAVKGAGAQDGTDRLHSSVDNPLAACFACWSRMAMWNQSRIGGFVTPASAKIDRRPEQPSVNAVSSVLSVRPIVSRFRRIRTAMSVPALATAPNTCRPPPGVSTLPMRTSKCRSPLWQLRMKVESKGMVMADAAAAGLTAAALRSCSPTFSVWPRKVSGLFPASTGSRCSSTPAATR